MTKCRCLYQVISLLKCLEGEISIYYMLNYGYSSNLSSFQSQDHPEIAV